VVVGTLGQVREEVRRHGVRSFATRVGDRARGHVLADSEHVWYVLDLTSERPARPLPDGLRLRTGGAELLPAVARLPTIALATARRWLDDGVRPWVVFEGDEPAFACWIFTGAFVYPGGTFRPAPRTALLEASVTSAAHRGRGIAPAAWDAVARGLAADGFEALVTLVPVENAPSRRAVEKAGFAEFARARRRTVGPWRRTSVDGGGPHAEHLRAELVR
jgi:RimJ/RimL family protein N-acetyltransferase